MRFLLLLSVSLALHAAEVKRSPVGKNVFDYKMQSAALGEERHVSIVLPANYESSTRRYPVLYLLHGLGDDNTAWTVMTNLSSYAEKMNIIIVMPDGGRSFYINSAAEPKAKFEDFIVKDLVAWADETFRTIPLRRSRAVAGLSMGGYGAALIGTKHYKRYAAIGAFSGVVSLAHNMPGDRFKNLTGAIGSPEAADRDVFAFTEKLPVAEAPLIYIACGGQDGLVTQNREWVKLLAEKKIPYEYREVSVKGHSWDFWDDNIQIFLDMLNRQWR